MKTYLLKVNDNVKAEALAGFLQKMDFVEEIRPVLHWQDKDCDDAELERQAKESIVKRKNPAVAKHLSDES